MDPAAVPDRPARAVHVRVRRELADEPTLFELRDYLIETGGRCSLVLHLIGDDGNGDWVIQASPQIAVSSEDSVLTTVRNYPCVEHVWKE